MHDRSEARTAKVGRPKKKRPERSATQNLMARALRPDAARREVRTRGNGMSGGGSFGRLPELHNDLAGRPARLALSGLPFGNRSLINTDKIGQLRLAPVAF